MKTFDDGNRRVRYAVRTNQESLLVRTADPTALAIDECQDSPEITSPGAEGTSGLNFNDQSTSQREQYLADEIATAGGFAADTCDVSAILQLERDI